MLGVRVQPWSLRYFSVAWASLVVALALMAAGRTYPAVPLFDPWTLIAVHLITVGWLTLLMLGALHQFVPVLTTRQLWSEHAPGATFILVAGGLLLMVLGFGGLPGGPWSASRLPLALALPFGGSSVVVGVAVAAANLGLTLARARPLSLPARYVAAALGFLSVTVLMGVTLALGLTAPAVLPPGLIAPLLGQGLPLHLLSGIAGWFTLTAMGVGLKLLSMFTLAPEERGLWGEAAWAGAVGGLALTWLSGLIQAFLNWPFLGACAEAGWALAAVGVALFLGDMGRLYRTRRRRELELNARFGAAALAVLGLVGVGEGAARLLGGGALQEVPVVFLALLGWLSGLGLSQLYKIVPFLTWIERYGRRMGRERVPLVQDLVKEPRAHPLFVAYFLGALGATLALAADAPWGFRVATLALALSVLGIGRELLWSRRATPEPRPAPTAVAVRPKESTPHP